VFYTVVFDMGISVAAGACPERRRGDEIMRSVKSDSSQSANKIGIVGVPYLSIYLSIYLSMHIIET